MVIEYKVKFENNGVTVTQSVGNIADDHGGSGQQVGPGTGGSGPQVGPGTGGSGPQVGPGTGGSGQQVSPSSGGRGTGQDGPIAVIFGPVVIGGFGGSVTRPQGRRAIRVVTHLKQHEGASIVQKTPTGRLDPQFEMQCQQAYNWCWAAVAAAARRYPLPPLTNGQCKEASRVLQPLDCCQNRPACDVQHSLQDALGKSLFEFVDGQITFNDLQAEINTNNRPVCARIVWDVDGDGLEDGAHFVVIHGCQTRNGVPYVSVMDPDTGHPEVDRMSTSHEIPFEMFRNHYRLYGAWHQTYRLKLEGE